MCGDCFAIRQMRNTISLALLSTTMCKNGKSKRASNSNDREEEIVPVITELEILGKHVSFPTALACCAFFHEIIAP